VNHLSWETASTGLATVIDQTIVSGTSFCLSVIIARRGSKEELGLYVLGLSIVLFALGLQNSLIIMPYIFYSPRQDGRIDVRYAGSTLIHACGLSIIGVMVLVAAAGTASRLSRISGLGNVIWALAGVITFILLREYARRVCFAWRQPSNAIVMDLLGAIAQISGLLFLAHLRLLSAAAAFWMTGIAFGFAALWWFGSQRKNFEADWSKVKSDFGLNWSFGKWIVAGGLVYSARSSLYPWFLASFHGTAATATFEACMGMTLFTNPFFLAFSNFLGPKAAHNFANGGIVALRRVVSKTTVLVSAFMAIFAVSILIFGDRLVVLIYGNQYAGSGAIISVLVFGLVAGAVTLGFDAGLYAMNRPNVIFHANVLGLCITLLFGFWMAKYYGPLGAAYGLLVASIVTSISKYFSFSRIIKDFATKETAPEVSRVECFGPEPVQIVDAATED